MDIELVTAFRKLASFYWSPKLKYLNIVGTELYEKMCCLEKYVLSHCDCDVARNPDKYSKCFLCGNYTDIEHIKGKNVNLKKWVLESLFPKDEDLRNRLIKNQDNMNLYVCDKCCEKYDYNPDDGIAYMTSSINRAITIVSKYYELKSQHKKEEKRFPTYEVRRRLRCIEEDLKTIDENEIPKLEEQLLKYYENKYEDREYCNKYLIDFIKLRRLNKDIELSTCVDSPFKTKEYSEDRDKDKNHSSSSSEESEDLSGFSYHSYEDAEEYWLEED